MKRLGINRHFALCAKQGEDLDPWQYIPHAFY